MASRRLASALPLRTFPASRSQIQRPFAAADPYVHSSLPRTREIHVMLLEHDSIRKILKIDMGRPEREILAIMYIYYVALRTGASRQLPIARTALPEHVSAPYRTYQA
jgi:hypothetical protein